MRKLLNMKKNIQGEYQLDNSAIRRSRVNAATGVVGSGAIGAGTLASAAVPIEITDMLTAVAVDAATLIAAGIVVWVGYKGTLIVWKIARRILGMAFSG